jgi:3-phosphoshikimate 1-carboxyvinyltransferase
VLEVKGDRVEITPVKRICGHYEPPPDKSISHRAAIFAAMLKGKSTIENFLFARDTLATVACLKSLGVIFEEDWQQRKLIVESNGFYEFKEPSSVLDAGNSATTIRLLTGLLSPLPHLFVFTGDQYLVKRPMLRIIEPLSLMGAEILSRKGGYPPLAVKGGKLCGIEYKLKVASAQVKSALILAGLHADGVTRIIEPLKSRDHTEKMLDYLGIKLKLEDDIIEVEPISELEQNVTFKIPGDPSSAAFFVVAGLLASEGELEIKNVCLNPTRTGFIEVLKRAGAAIETKIAGNLSGEPVGSIFVWGGRKFKYLEVRREEVPFLIDEIPILSVAAAYADGVSYFEGLSELRVKETDRLMAIATNLQRMNIKVEVEGDSLRVFGGQKPQGAALESYGDHRIAMAFTIAALFASGQSIIHHPECVEVSYPSFFSDLSSLLA